MATKLESLIEHWKGILASIAGILVVALQIIQLLMSSTIETRLDLKTENLNQALASHGQITRQNRQLLVELHNELHTLEAHQQAK